MPRPKPTEPTKFIHFYAHPSQLDYLEFWARTAEVSQSYAIRRIIQLAADNDELYQASLIHTMNLS